MREDGLKASEDMLAADTQGFIDFFNKIKEDTQKATNMYDEAKNKKGKMAGDLRRIVEEQNSSISKINKSLENLRVYYEYKNFLDSLAPDNSEFKQKLLERKQMVRKKIEEMDRQAAAALNKKGAADALKADENNI